MAERATLRASIVCPILPSVAAMGVAHVQVDRERARRQLGATDDRSHFACGVLEPQRAFRQP